MKLEDRPHIKDWRSEDCNGQLVHRLTVNDKFQISITQTRNDEFEAKLEEHGRPFAQCRLHTNNLTIAKDKAVMSAIKFAYRTHRASYTKPVPATKK